MELTDKVAVVTGASSGIGRAVALGYARSGAAVACISRSVGRLRDTALQIKKEGGRALPLAADVCDFPCLEEQFRIAEETFGRIDLVFSAAGDPSENKEVEASDPQAFRHTLEVNLVGAFNTAKAAIPVLKRNKGGQMLFVGSGMGHRAAEKRAAYASSKAGLSMLVRVLAMELVHDQIAVNELIPGPVLTDFIAGREDRLRQGVGATEWFKEADDVVPMVLFIAALPQPGPTGQTFSLARREL